MIRGECVHHIAERLGFGDEPPCPPGADSRPADRLDLAEPRAGADTRATADGDTLALCEGYGLASR